MDIELDDIVETENEVELIASGYEWICPNCEEFNKEIEITEFVTCDKCNQEYKVQDYYHAYN